MKTRALAKGKEFAKEKNAELEVISFETVEQRFMVFPQAIMTFRLVYETQEINNPNDPNKITITTIGNIMNNNQETIISRSPSQPSDSLKINKKQIAIKELKELKELLDLGLITQEEFDKTSSKLKAIILNNILY